MRTVEMTMKELRSLAKAPGMGIRTQPDAIQVWLTKNDEIVADVTEAIGGSNLESKVKVDWLK